MGTQATVTVRVGAQSHKGLVRSENQDRMTRFASPFGEVFLVADGMGGHQGGSTAAAMVVEGFERHLNAQPATLAPAQALQETAHLVNAEVHAAGSSGAAELAGMGSTIVLALLRGAEVTVAHVGDSRAYLHRNGTLERLTVDHTFVQKMVEAGILTEAQARRHPHASVLTRSVGNSAVVELQVAEPRTLQDGDALLLCSDGLSGYVEDAELERVLREAATPEAGSQSLLQVALETGGQDNVTVQVVGVDFRVPVAAAAAPPARPRRIGALRELAALAAIAVLAALLGRPVPTVAEPAQSAAPASTPVAVVPLDGQPTDWVRDRLQQMGQPMQLLAPEALPNAEADALRAAASPDSLTLLYSPAQVSQATRVMQGLRAVRPELRWTALPDTAGRFGTQGNRPDSAGIVVLVGAK